MDRLDLQGGREDGRVAGSVAGALLTGSGTPQNSSNRLKFKIFFPVIPLVDMKHPSLMIDVCTIRQFIDFPKHIDTRITFVLILNNCINK